MTDNAAGSGFLISEDGLVATCYHVIADETEDVITISGDFILGYDTADEIICPIESVVSYSQANDVAILKIDTTDLSDEDITLIPLGDSDSLAVDDDIYVISSPDAAEATAGSVVRGNVSNKYITPYGSEEIQLSVGSGVVGGSSGGAVVKMNSDSGLYEIVGMESAVYNASDLEIIVPVNLIREAQDYINDDSALTLEDFNAQRRYFGRLSETPRVMGERYDKSVEDVQQAVIFHSSDTATWLYDKFSHNNEENRHKLDDLYIQEYKNGNFYIGDMSGSSDYRLGINKTDEDPFNYFFVENSNNFFQGHGIQTHDNGNSIFLTQRIYVDENNQGVADSEGIWVDRSEEAEIIEFRRYAQDVPEGPSMQIMNEWIFFSVYKNGETDGKSLRFNFQTKELYAENYINGETDGEYVKIDLSEAPEIEYTSSSETDGVLTYGEWGFTAAWTEDGITMRSPTLFAERRADGFSAEFMNPNNPYDPIVKISTLGEYMLFSASASDYSGIISKDNSYYARYNKTTGRIAQISKKETDKVSEEDDKIWFIGEAEITDEENWSVETQGKGALYDTGLDDLYIGEILDNQPDGQGAWIGKRYMILDGEWYEDELIEPNWNTSE